MIARKLRFRYLRWAAPSSRNSRSLSATRWETGCLIGCRGGYHPDIGCRLSCAFLGWSGPCSGDKTSPSQRYARLVRRRPHGPIYVQTFARGLAENDVSSARHWRVWGRSRPPDRWRRREMAARRHSCANHRPGGASDTSAPTVHPAVTGLDRLLRLLTGLPDTKGDTVASPVLVMVNATNPGKPRWSGRSSVSARRRNSAI